MPNGGLLHVTKESNMASRATTSRDRVRAHRATLRAQGLRPIQFWVPDVNSPEFKAEARRQSLAANASMHAAADQDWVDAVSILTDDDFWNHG
jgi:Protein  of unknown function (DUF3018)